MKFNCGPTWEEKWHKWFAWHPITLGGGDCRWLETIERKGTYSSLSLVGCEWVYEYRAGK